jgi:hypothetical protein
MSLKSGQAVTVLFSTQNPTTGAAADATGTPTGTLYVNGTANGATVTVTNITTGVYKAAVTLPSLTAGDVCSLRVAATVASVAGEGIIWQDVADTSRASDVATSVATVAGYVDTEVASVLAAVDTEVAAIKAKTDNLPSDPADDSDIDAQLAAIAGYLDTEIAAIKAKTDNLPSDPATSPLATAAAVATVDGIVDSILEDTGTTLPGTLAGLSTLTAAQVNAEVVDVLRTDTIPDSYAADGAQPTFAQAVLMILQFLSERSVSGTTVTVKKPDGSTTAMTFTLSDATNPASITRS